MESCDDGRMEPFPSDDEELYRREVHGLMRVATTMIGPADASDVVSEAVLRVMTSPGWGRVRNKRAYLYRSVVNEAKMLIRSRERRRRRELITSSLSPRVVEPTEPVPEVHAALEGLSVAQRAMVHLVYWEDLSIAQAALLLGVTSGTAKQHLHRARRQLRRVLDE